MTGHDCWKFPGLLATSQEASERFTDSLADSSLFSVFFLQILRSPESSSDTGQILKMIQPVSVSPLSHPTLPVPLPQ